MNAALFSFLSFCPSSSFLFCFLPLVSSLFSFPFPLHLFLCSVLLPFFAVIYQAKTKSQQQPTPMNAALFSFLSLICIFLLFLSFSFSVFLLCFSSLFSSAFPLHLFLCSVLLHFFAVIYQAKTKSQQQPTPMNAALFSFLSSFLYLSVLPILLFFVFLLCFSSLFSSVFPLHLFLCSVLLHFFDVIYQARQSLSSSRRQWMPLCFRSYLPFVSFCSSSPSLFCFLLCFHPVSLFLFLFTSFSDKCCFLSHLTKSQQQPTAMNAAFLSFLSSFCIFLSFLSFFRFLAFFSSLFSSAFLLHLFFFLLPFSAVNYHTKS